MLKNLKVRNKLRMLTGTLLLCLLIAGAAGVYFFKISNHAMHEIADVDMKHVELLYEIENAALINENCLLEIIVNAGDASTIQKYQNLMAEGMGNMETHLESIDHIGHLTQEEAAFLETLKAEKNAMQAAGERIVNIAGEGDETGAMAAYAWEEDKFNTFMSTIRIMLGDFLEDKTATEELSDKEFKEAEVTLITVVAIAFCAGIVLAITITRSITVPLEAVIKMMGMVASGDFSQTMDAVFLKRKDEMGLAARMTEQMAGDLSTIVGHVRFSSGELASASENISSASEEVSASAEEVSASIQEVAVNADHQNGSIIEVSETLVQLSSLIQMAQRSAETAELNSKKTAEAAQKGRENVQDTVHAIEKIRMVSDETGVTLDALNTLSKKVRGIIDTINSIASQTNLLALNAAIEAARAGEHGRGFSVVADEVRKLSVETNTGANEIAILIQNMIVQIERAVDSMDAGKTAVSEGVDIARSTDASFVRILDAVEQIGSDVVQILDITKDEVASSDQIVQLIDSVAGYTETTLANSQEVAAASEEQASVVENLAAEAEETSSMAAELYSLVEKFKLRGNTDAS